MANATVSDHPFTAAAIDHPSPRRTRHAVKPATLAAAHHRGLFERLPDATLIAGPSGAIIDANQAALAATGYTHDELARLRFDDLCTPAPPWLSGATLTAPGLPWQGITELRGKDGARARRDIRIEAPLGATEGFVVTLVPERNADGSTRPVGQGGPEPSAGQDALAVSEARYRALVDEVPAVIYTEQGDRELSLISMSRYVETLLGYPVEAFFADRGLWMARVHPDDRELVQNGADRMFERGEPFAEEYRLIARDGRIVWVNDVALPMRDATGTAIGWQGVAMDVTDLKQAQEDLQTSEVRFRTAFENAPIGMALVEPDGHILEVNRTICEILGYPEAELVTTTFTRIAHPDDVDRCIALLERVLAGEFATVAIEKRDVRKDGQIIWTLLTASLIRDSSGQPLHFIAELQDITARKAAEAELAATHHNTRQVLARITDGFYAMDRDWRLTYLNEAAEQIFRGSPAELLGKNFWQEHPLVAETDLYSAFHQAMAQGTAVDVELSYPPTEAWYETRAYPSPDGLSVFFRDVTANKRLEQDLRDALREARAANLATRTFLAMMSHELRTPMQAVLGYADLLSAGRGGSLSAEQVLDVQSIQQGSRRIITLIDQMLDLSRMQAGQLDLTLTPVDLAPIVEQVRQDVAPQAASKALDLIVDLPPSLPLVLADASRLHQILLNLAGNAVKFTDGGWVRLSARATESGVDVAVSDSGIGIAADALGYIFDDFRQAERTTHRRYGGAGLGLAIARRLAEQQGGSITVTSHPGKGSTFTLHLPLASYAGVIG